MLERREAEAEEIEKQSRLKEKKPVKNTGPQVDYVDSKGVQWIEINRGCKRGCEFCYADRNFKEFPPPEISAKKVQIIGEGILYDSRMPNILDKLGESGARFGLNQGIDYRLLTPEIAEALARNRFGTIIEKTSRWSKGVKIAWDRGLEQRKGIQDAIDLLESVGYRRHEIMVFVLVNYKTTYSVCQDKLYWLRRCGVQVDPCTWNTTKRKKIEAYWSKEEMRAFVSNAGRLHNIHTRAGVLKKEYRSN